MNVKKVLTGTLAAAMITSMMTGFVMAEETKENSDITIAYVTSALTTQIFRDQVTRLRITVRKSE